MKQTLLFTIGIFFLWTAITRAETVIFDFASGPGESFYTVNTGNLWDIDMDGPELRVFKEADDGTDYGDTFIIGGIGSNFFMEGDFTAIVDFTLYGFPQTSEPGRYNEVLAVITPVNDRVFEIFRLRSGTNDRTVVFTYPPDQTLGRSDLAYYSGRFRLIRTGTTIKAEVAPNLTSDFATIGTLTNYTTDPVSIFLEAVQGRGPNDSVRSITSMDISFDNLIIEADKISGLPTADIFPPTGAVHAYDNMIWPPNNKMVSVLLEGYVFDELSAAKDSEDLGVSSAYLLIDGSEKIVLRDDSVDLLDEENHFSVEIEVQAKAGSVYIIDLYASDKCPASDGGPNSGLVDSTYIRVPHNLGKK